MNRDNLTIVIPTRDRPHLLAEGLRSIFEAQPIVPRVVVSDNSTTDHHEMVTLRERYGFDYIRRSGQLGMVEHQNACFALATGHWMLLLHDDDQLYPNVLGRLQGFLAECGGLGIVFGGVETFGANGATLHQWIPKARRCDRGDEALLAVAMDWGTRAPGTIYGVDALRELGGFERVDRWNADYAHALLFAYRRGVAFVPELVGRYRLGGHEQATEFGTLEDATRWLAFTARQVELLRKLPCSTEIVDRVLDYMVWSTWLAITRQWRERRPSNLFRLARTGLALSTHPGEWQGRVRRDAPHLFRRPWWLGCAAYVASRKARSAVRRARRLCALP